MALVRTSWEFKVVQTRSVSHWQQKEWNCAPPESSNWSKCGQCRISSRWNDITHQLRVQVGHNEVSFKLAADGIELHTNWECKWGTMSLVSNLQQREWHYAPPESANWCQYQIRSRGNGITHSLGSNWSKRHQYRIRGRWNARYHARAESWNYVSIKLATDGMVLRTGCEWTLVTKISVSN